jgi:cold shock CspA family protein
MQEENYPAARLAFDAAIDIEPNYFPLRYWYGDFLLRKMDDAEGAAQQFQAAVELEPQNIEIQLGAARAQLYMHRYDEVFGILKTLLPKAPTLPYRLAVRVFDLAVSVNGRKADDAFGQDEFNEALARLKDLRATYSAIPEKLRDDIMKTKLGKAQLTARGLTGRLSGKDADEASDILHWLAEESGRLFGIRLDAQSEPLIEQSPNHGEIRRVHPNGFGFLATEDGRELFFHRLDVRPESDMALLRPGMKVVYGEGSNSKGPAAVSVRRV